MASVPTVTVVSPFPTDDGMDEVADHVTTVDLQLTTELDPRENGQRSTADCIVVVHSRSTDAFETVESIREHHDDVPIVVLAQSHDAEVATQAANADIDRYLPAANSTESTARNLEETLSECLIEPDIPRRRELTERDVLERAPIPMFAIDEDHSVVHWNDAMGSLTDRDAEEVRAADDPHRPFYARERPVLADLLVEGVSDDEISAWYGDWEHSPYDEDGYVSEQYFEHTDSWLRFAATPIRKQGDTVGAVETFQNITPRKQRERELERYETIVEASGDPVYTLDADGYVTYANEALAEMLGFEVDEILGEHASEMMPRDHVERGESLIRESLNSDGGTGRGTFEMDVRTKGGETITCENHVAILPYEDEFRGTVGVLRDITERQRRLQTLEEQRDRLTAVFETIPEPIAHVTYRNGEMKIINVNSTFEEIFGYDTEYLQDRSINELIVPDGKKADARRIDATVADTDFLEREVRRKTVDGMRDFLLRTTRFTVGSGDRESIVAYLDITAQKERQRELERQNERLDQFTSVVSHDLRNPLNVATGRLELAREAVDSEHLEDVATSLERMENLVENLHALAIHGERVTERQDLDLATVAGRSWDVVDSPNGADLVIDGTRTFRGNRSRVRSLFENLFRNAIDHAGPAVTVTVCPLGKGFAVEDDGPGLPNTDGDVFEAGFSTDDDGSGLGLNIVQEIVEAHGWTIDATDGSRGGARFEVTGVETPSSLDE